MSTYNGSIWSAPAELFNTASRAAVSCAGPTFCIAVGIAIDTADPVALFDGTHWAARGTMPDGFGGAIDCPAVNWCVAVAGTSAVVFNGTSWSAPVSTGVQYGAAVDCTSQISGVI